MIIDSKYSARIRSLLVLLPLVLTGQALIGQRAQETAVPLKNWAAPLYWQPNQGERGAAPQLQFSANQVSANALTFIAITPCRLVDTRGAAAGFNGMDPFAGPAIASKATLTIPVQSPTEATTNTEPAPCGVIPSIAQAYSFNLTVVPVAVGAVDYVSLWPAGSPQPFVATINDPQGAIVANAAIVPAGPTSSPGYGGVSVYNDGPATTNVIIDMNGFYAAPTDVIGGNTAIGLGSLTSNTTGAANTASGQAALQNNTTGNANTADGSYALFSNTTGCCNTAIGQSALLDNTASNNTATGFGALQYNSTGTGNTANGTQALSANTTGNNNTAVGQNAMQDNTTGCCNTASGQAALNANTTGSLNAAFGGSALQDNTAGNNNVAAGQAALLNNTTGNNNTSTGQAAMQNNTTGCCNTASGQAALHANMTGNGNAAFGGSALQDNTTGGGNAALGQGALQNNTTGSGNIAVGQGAGSNLTTGGGNIDIGNAGVAGEGGVIRIGASQGSFFVAGVSSATVSGAAVLVDTTTGQLGVASSSRRFKEDIQDMGEASSGLLRLRPVTFRYKQPFADGSKPIEYGLVAEEVAEVYPDLVARTADGQIETVKYQVLDSMLLNEVQKQAEQNRQQTEQIRQQAEQIRQQAEQNQQQAGQIRSLEERLAALEALLTRQ